MAGMTGVERDALESDDLVSDELGLKPVLRRDECLRERLLLFRTEDGCASVLDAHCRHLGAHLGYGGEVEGQIEFDSDPDEPGEMLLDFDPSGQLTEILDAGGDTILERDFP